MEVASSPASSGMAIPFVLPPLHLFDVLPTLTWYSPSRG